MSITEFTSLQQESITKVLSTALEWYKVIQKRWEVPVHTFSDGSTLPRSRGVSMYREVNSENSVEYDLHEALEEFIKTFPEEV